MRVSLLVLALFVFTPAFAADRPARGRDLPRIGGGPLAFEENHGQASAEGVRFLVRAEGYRAWIGATEATVAFATTGEPADRALGVRPRVWTPVRMTLVGAREDAPVVGVNPGQTRVRYFRGADPANWITDARRFGSVRVTEAWPHIDVVYRGHEHLAYDFILAPGADPAQLALSFEGADGVRVNGGALEITVGGRVLRHEAPTIYQEIDGRRVQVEGRFVLRDEGIVGFAVDAHDRKRELVIDPDIRFFTYLGGSGDDFVFDVFADGNGDLFVCGASDTADFTGAINPFEGGFDAFVAKVAGDGASFEWVTYIGGQERVEDPLNPGTLFPDQDNAEGVALDSTGRVVVCGIANTSDFPVTADAFDSTIGSIFDVFVARLDASGNLDYCSYLGGDENDGAFAIAVGPGDDVYLTGAADAGFPETAGAVPRDAGDNQDVFVTRMDLDAATTADQLVYSTFIGGGSHDRAFDIAVDSAGNAHVTGHATTFFDGGRIRDPYPTTSDALLVEPDGGANSIFDAAIYSVVACDATLTAEENLVYSTYLSDAGFPNPTGFALDVLDGLTYITGVTGPGMIPTTAGSFQPSANGTQSEAFLLVIDTAISGSDGLVYGTYFGSTGSESARGLHVDDDGVVIVGTSSRTDLAQTQRGKKIKPVDFPTTDGPTSESGWYVVRFDPAGNGTADLLFGTVVADDVFIYQCATIAAGNDLDVAVVGVAREAGLATTGALDETFEGAQDGFLAVLTIAGPAFGDVTGTVTDNGGAAIAGASVSAGGIAATTDPNGLYTLVGVSAGDQTLTVTATGFDPASRTITVLADTSITEDVTLTPAGTGGNASLDCITYTTSGGPSGDKHLNITVSIDDGAGTALDGIDVTLEVTDPGGAVTTHSGTTNTSGEFRVSFNNAASGIWSTEVTDIDGQPFSGTPVHSFVKGTDPSGTFFCN